jgi:hypothetical protein
MSSSFLNRVAIDEMNELMRLAVKRAIEENRKCELPEMIQVDDKWFRRYPDGLLEVVTESARKSRIQGIWKSLRKLLLP